MKYTQFKDLLSLAKGVVWCGDRACSDTQCSESEGCSLWCVCVSDIQEQKQLAFPWCTLKRGAVW